MGLWDIVMELEMPLFLGAIKDNDWTLTIENGITIARKTSRIYGLTAVATFSSKGVNSREFHLVKTTEASSVFMGSYYGDVYTAGRRFMRGIYIAEQYLGEVMTIPKILQCREQYRRP